MKSSYEQNHYGDVLCAIVDGWKPRNCVELGVLGGYSTFHIGEALRANGNSAQLHAYDLFEDYPFNHVNQAEVESFLSGTGLLNDIVHIHKDDAFKVHELFGTGSVSLLHVDLSNTGDTLKHVMEAWDEKLEHLGIILFEGGTQERDNVEWMKKFDKKPIKSELENNPIIAANYIFATYLPFPGLTMLLKKR